MTDAKSRSWYREGANEDFSSEDFEVEAAVEDAAGAVEVVAFVEAVPVDFLPILNAHTRHKDSRAQH